MTKTEVIQRLQKDLGIPRFQAYQTRGLFNIRKQKAVSFYEMAFGNL